MRVELHPDARAELRSAALWYEEQRDGLGREFTDAVTTALVRISRSPESFPPWPGLGDRTRPIRRSVIQGYPYVVAFEPYDDRLLVLAVAHARRRPLYWLTRATP